MTLEARYAAIRSEINDCRGFRILEDDDVIEDGDGTLCGSILLSTTFGEDWHKITTTNDLALFIGRTVNELNDPKLNNEMDATERLFRRRDKR